MTETIPRPRADAVAPSTGDGLLICSPLGIEARAVRRGLASAGQYSGSATVLRTGYGTSRAGERAGEISDSTFRQMVVMGVGAGLTADLSPGDLVVATEVGASGGQQSPCPSAPMLAGELRRAGLRVHLGPVVTVDHLVRKGERAELAASGAILADMESALLVAAAGDRPVAVVRAVSDTPDRPAVSIRSGGIVSGGLAALRSLRAAAPVVERWAAACAAREVLLAGPRSFCAGVERAIEIVERALEMHGAPVYVHEEVEGTLGEAPASTVLVQTPEDVAALESPDGAKIVYLMQTTLSVDEAASVAGALREKFPDLRAPGSDDICYATTNRQASVREVAAASDVVLVAGSKNSSNSVRLVEVCERAGTPAYLIDDASDIQLSWLSGVSTVGLTAGASAPPAVVSEIVTALSGLGPVSVSERVTTTESIRFGLPKEVRQ
jgi:4-hydroxy-3-methylbut-2-enyl diphosphate reductase IspH